MQAELKLKREFGIHQTEMIAQMDSLRSPKSGFYDDWEDSRGRKSGYTLLPDIACGMISELIGYKTGGKTRDDTVGRLSLTLSALENQNVDCCSGLYPTLSMTDTAEPINGDSKTVTAVDNVHLFLAGIIVGKVLPELHEAAQRITNKMDFSFFLDRENGLLHGAFLPDSSAFLDYHNGALASETRLADYVYMVQTGDFDHYFRLLRNIPQQCASKLPEGYPFQALEHKPKLESNGGNLFEVVYPQMFVPEVLASPNSWGVQHEEMIAAEIEYGNLCLNGLWGHIPADSPIAAGNYEYVVAGIPELAANSAHVEPNVISPFASLLVTPFCPDEVAENLSLLENTYPTIYAPDKGYSDSVNIKTGMVSQRFLASNVGMGLVGVSDYTLDGYIRDLTTEYFQPILPILASER